MKLWETYFRLWEKFGLALNEHETHFGETYLSDGDCIDNYFGSVHDKCFVSGI